MSEILHSTYEISSSDGAMKLPANAFGLVWDRIDGGRLLRPEDTLGNGDLLFAFSAAPLPACFGAPLLSKTVRAPGRAFLLRLDTVRFPPGAVAYRHTHAGAGTRVLVSGELTLISDHDTQTATPGSAWFEDALSPVRAEASENARETRFIRAMTLPLEFEGQATINILDPDDAAQPRLQQTERYVDAPIQWLPG